MARVTARCLRGHAFTPENTALRADGRGRICRACRRERERARYERERRSPWTPAAKETAA